MEGVAFILIGAMLFSQSWYVLEMYPDGRTMGVFTGALALGVLIALVLTPMVFIGGDPDSDVLTETTVMKMLILLWAGYGVGVAAQGLWDFDMRALGFYSAILTAGSAVALFYYASTLSDAYGDNVMLTLSAGSLVLAIVSGMVFFYLAISDSWQRILRPVAGWFILVGSVVVVALGLLLISTVIEVS